ncbi:hypothetical protein Z043_103435 [Scleropages formosus]|uniref:Uncharacterized protein n=1 Tax=Scleropages formosus TaxID=113540 RepID=A0A0P7V5W9_SCLFO|nr:hypothetical protein Z043_103435 [Scleropages formosus]
MVSQQQGSGRTSNCIRRTNFTVMYMAYHLVQFVNPVITRIHGNIPTWIKRSFLWNGPDKFDFGNQR